MTPTTGIKPTPAESVPAVRPGKPATRHALSQPARSAVLAALGGTVTELAFSERSWWAAAVIGVALLVLALHGASGRRALMLGLVWGLGFFLPHIWWANEAVGPLPWVGLAGLESLIVAAGCAGAAVALRWPPARRWPVLGAAVFGAVWTASEQVRQVWPFGGFPWGRLAFSQVDGPLVRLAPLGGAPLVSFTVVALGYLVAMAWVGARTRTGARGVGILAGVAAVLGAATLAPVATAAESGVLRVAAVQGDVSTPGLDAFAQAREVLENHVAATRALLEDVRPGDVDVILWPENASDINPRADLEAARSIDGVAAALGAPILLGTDRRTDDARYNDMVLWEPGSGATFAYSKQVPAAFGEYIPWRPLFRLFSPEVDRVRVDIARGSEPAVVPVQVDRLGRTVVVGTPICFEVAYDAVVRDAVRAGAEVLVIPTNNASFGFTSESIQQLAMSRFRAVEHGRAAVQISTVGVSGVIRPDGAVVDRTELFTQDSMRTELPLRTSITVADRLGDAPTLLVVLAALGAIGCGWRSSRRSRLVGRPPGIEASPLKSPPRSRQFRS
jgi:apolipoprotein N-acyltransferase